MKDARENTVSAENQLPRSSSVFYIGRADAPKRLLIVGNSITRHAPSAGIGWHGDWGMAASAPECDYVHRLTAMLEERGIDVLTKVHQLATWERSHEQPDCLLPLNEDRDFDPDAVVFRLGENVRLPDGFKEHLSEFISHICPHGKVVFTTTVWKNKYINDAIEAVAKERGEPLIDIYEVGRRDELMAIGKFEHKGVAMHPSDAGMEYIANAVFPELVKILEE